MTALQMAEMLEREAQMAKEVIAESKMEFISALRLHLPAVVIRFNKFVFVAQ